LPTIPNFPKSLLDEHKNWHHARHQVSIGNPPSGYGLDFLQFHRDYIRRALAWNAQKGNDPRLTEPWAAVPEPIRQSPCYNQAAEARILFEPESFASADELGRFIESSFIHGCIHQQAALLYGEPDINDFDVATRNTVFYNIHGMIDRWWQNWEGLGRFRDEDSYWWGRFDGEDEVALYYDIHNGSWWLGKSIAEAGRSGLHAVSGLDWRPVGDSRCFGRLNDGRLFRIWDVDGDGRLEIVFKHPRLGYWVEGKLAGGRILWKPIRLEPQGYPLTL
jgi:hypothetical protein